MAVTVAAGRQDTAAALATEGGARRRFVMIRTTATRVLLATALVITFPIATTAQDEVATPEGTEWYLVAYDAGGPELTPVPWDVVATLTLDAGQAVGSTGCNGYFGTYQMDGERLTFSPSFLTDRGCIYETRGEVQAAYMAALPRVARWAIDTGTTDERALILFDADDEHLLRFSSSATARLVGQIREMTDQLEAQQQVIEDLRARIKELEQGG
jgi:heat shock protein HslJ